MPAKRKDDPEAATRWAGLGGGQVHSDVSFSRVPSELLSDAVDAVLSVGALVSFSRTSDGGAVHVRVIDAGSVRVKEWCSDADALSACLQALLSACT